MIIRESPRREAGGLESWGTGQSESRANGVSRVTSTVGLVPWKPGQSGNPKGGSAKQSQRKRLREALDTILESVPPESLLQQIPNEIIESLPTNVTLAEIIALRVALIAATAKKPEAVLAAAQLILNAQERPSNARPPRLAPKPPILPSTEDRRRSIAEQLGIVHDEE